MNELKPASAASDFINVIRGFCMGAADTVPGVSGGTVALILGHYTRLITAISHVDGQTISLLRNKQYADAATRLDLRFMVALLVGILTGIATLSGVMHFLLDHHRPETLSVFLGFLIASVWIVKSNIDSWHWTRGVTLVLGVIIAVAICLLPVNSSEPTFAYIFVAASVAICAMILPGISGAFVLLLFGIYEPITGLVKEFVRLHVTSHGALQLLVFACGCLFGLFAFSKLLRYLLASHRDVTMAGLIGLMIGSVLKLYPLQIPTVETENLEEKHRVMMLVAPQDWHAAIWPLVILMAVAFVFVLILERRFALAVGPEVEGP